MKFKKILPELISVLSILLSLPFSQAGTYDFNNPNSKAYEEESVDLPPSSYDIGKEMDPQKYKALQSSDDTKAIFSTETKGGYEFQRFTFKIDEPLENKNLTVVYEGNGLVGANAGLFLYIWNWDSKKWEQIGEQPQFWKEKINLKVTGKFSNYVNPEGYINLLVETKNSTAGFSCPFLYVWDGARYQFITDMSGAGGLGYEDASGTYPFWHPFPEDTVVVHHSLLKEEEGKFKLVIAEDQDEVTYLDQVKLFTVDHSPEVEVFSSLAYSYSKAFPFFLHTVKRPQAPLEARDETGKDIRDKISAVDNVATQGEQFHFNTLILDFGDLSNAKQIKLIYRGWIEWPSNRENDARLEYLAAHADEQYSYPNFVEVMNEKGEWEKIEFPFIQGKPKTFVLDITNWFKAHVYKLRIHTWFKIHFDYIAIDTTPDEEVTVQESPFLSGNLYWKGPSVQTGGGDTPLIPDFHEIVNSSRFYDWEGNFTRYGDVWPLLTRADDKFVIMHVGDAVEMEFAALPLSATVRDYMVFTNGFYKRDFVRFLLGQKTGNVEPLPFQGMLYYPYPATMSYPYDEEHNSYLQEYNTRKFNETFFRGSNTIYTDYVGIICEPAVKETPSPLLSSNEPKKAADSLEEEKAKQKKEMEEQMLREVTLEAQSKTAPAGKAPGLTLARAVVGTGVENLEPRGAAEVFPSSIEKIFCFIEATDILKDSEIIFAWFYGDKELEQVSLTVKKGAGLKTFASRKIDGLKGEWRVEIIDAAEGGTILKTIKFKVE